MTTMGWVALIISHSGTALLGAAWMWHKKDASIYAQANAYSIKVMKEAEAFAEEARRLHDDVKRIHQMEVDLFEAALRRGARYEA